MSSLPALFMSSLAALGLYSEAAAARQVTVPGTATGYFGYNPSAGGDTPFVAALSVNGPGTITISYVSGQVQCSPTWAYSGPNGQNSHQAFNAMNVALPLDEAVGINTAAYPTENYAHACALIGAFVPRSQASMTGFQPVDGTKGVAAVGIVPSTLFFVGIYHSITVNGPGTLYLGINDNVASNNPGSFTVDVTSP
jgi:hypothetical protein